MIFYMVGFLFVGVGLEEQEERDNSQERAD
jgi:hypothetical protein